MADERPGNPGSPDVHDPAEDGGGGTSHDSLPPFTFRHRLIPAVHAVVAERFDGSVPDLSAVYAAVTARTANALVSGEPFPYSVFAGRVFVRVPGEEDLIVFPKDGAGSGLGAHAWAGRRHPSGRMEVADLSTRHFNAWFVLPGFPRFPRAVWAFEDEVPRAFRYAVDTEGTGRVRERLRHSLEDSVADAVREVAERFRTSPG